MLLRITNRCHGGCSHCMIDGSGPEGEHMPMDTFERALGLVDRLGVKVLLVSGGEPFEHPDVFRMADMLKTFALENILFVSFASNGHFALDEEKMESVRRTGIGVQVTCDPRFYPRILLAERFPGNQFTFEDSIRTIFPCRRTRAAGLVPNRTSPNCFNIRSATRSVGFLKAQTILAVQGRVCCPSINIDGTVVAGETDTCHPIGTVDSSITEIEEALRNMHCKRCGLVDNLQPMYMEAIGEQQ
jgi:hypothetical protein